MDPKYVLSVKVTKVGCEDSPAYELTQQVTHAEVFPEGYATPSTALIARLLAKD